MMMTDILKLSIEELLNKKHKKDVIAQLQKINEIFLKNYKIQIDGVNIYPIEIEIYYKNDRYIGDFLDNMIHDNKDRKQRNRYKKIYKHPTFSPNKRGGFDVVLSDDDYYALSILIRSAYIGDLNDNNLSRGINKIRTSLEKHINNNSNKDILVRNENIFNSGVMHHQRISGDDYYKNATDEYEDEYRLNSFYENQLTKLADNSCFGKYDQKAYGKAGKIYRNYISQYNFNE